MYSSRTTTNVTCLGAFLALLTGCGASNDAKPEEKGTTAEALCGNLALTATASAQSTFTDYAASHVNDGNRSTALDPSMSWTNTNGAGGVLPQWLELDLKTASTVNQVTLYTSVTYPIQDYDIQTWNGSTWVTAAQVRGNTGTVITTAITSVTTSKLRILAISGPSGNLGPAGQPAWARVNELEITGCDTASATKVSGRVIESATVSGSHKPIAGATVQVGSATTTTDAAGNYSISNLAYGSYSVHVAGAGYTYGSDTYQAAHSTFTLSASSPNVGVSAITGYNHNPIVYAFGFQSDPGNFFHYPVALAEQGYAAFYPNIETTPKKTPSLTTNALTMIPAIDNAKDVTGQSKVIVMGHSMGGLVARGYMESRLYRGDVSQFFSFGSPHLGIPAISNIACLPNQPAVCDMTAPGMALFNVTHFKPQDIDYHEIGGDSPMWTTKKIACFKLFGKKHCVSIPWPDTTFRNGWGWATGVLIPGPDDAFINTCSAIGQPGLGIDRFVTEDVHEWTVGPRDYFRWDNDNQVSHESYDNCVKPLLVDGSRGTCGVRGLVAWGCTLSGGLIPGSLSAAAAGTAATLAQASGLTVANASSTVAQQATPLSGILLAGQTVSQNVVVEGGGTTFSVAQQSGSANVYLVDPTGRVINPAYVASITGGSPTDADADTLTTAPQDAVVYQSTSSSASYYFPNARPGTWQVVAQGNSDIPSSGSTYSSQVAFDTSYLATFDTGSAFLAPNTTASFSLQLPAVSSATVHISVVTPNGTTTTLTPVAAGNSRYTASYAVPTNNSGYARVNWSAVATRSDGTAFERGGFADVQIESTQLTWSGVQTVSRTPRTNDSTLYQNLVFNSRVTSTYSGSAQLSADLVDGSNIVVARVNQALTLALGVNNVALTFNGNDIYASALNGPYKLTDIVLIDTRGAAILAATVNNAYTTSAYHAADFATAHGTPSVKTTGPYTGFRGDSIQLGAVGVDPEGDTLAYGWDLDNNGSFETNGRTPIYVAPAVAQPLSHKVSVRVTDPAGHSATASTFIDVSPNKVGNLALQATASASSTYSAEPYAAAHVNDGSTDTAQNPLQSWVNVQGQLPATLDLSFSTARTFSQITVYSSEGYVIQDYDLSVWNGSTWNLVARVRGNSQVINASNFAATNGIKVRLTGIRGPNLQPTYVRVNELQVYGY